MIHRCLISFVCQHRRAQYDKLSVMVEELRDSEAKLIVIVKSLDDINDPPNSVDEDTEVRFWLLLRQTNCRVVCQFPNWIDLC